MKHARSLKLALIFAGVCAVGVAASCSEDGVTPNCPPLPLYQTFPLGDASRPDALSGDSGAADEARNAAIRAGCLTGPSNGDNAGNGGSTSGSAGNGGSAGKGGSAGTSSTSSGESGNSGVENAGAAGHD